MKGKQGGARHVDRKMASRIWIDANPLGCTSVEIGSFLVGYLAEYQCKNRGVCYSIQSTKQKTEQFMGVWCVLKEAKNGRLFIRRVIGDEFSRFIDAVGVDAQFSLSDIA